MLKPYSCTLLLLATVTLAACAAPAAPVSPTGAVQSATESARPTPAPPKLGEFDPASVQGIDLAAYPVLPSVSSTVRAIYQAGQASGNNPRVFSKLGDCMTETHNFLIPVGEGDYDLGDHVYLQEVIDNFAGVPAREGAGWQLDAFANPGLAAAQGFNVAGPLDPTWADPQWCQPGESPLACEYRVSRPSFVLIMFGTNDVKFLEAGVYDYYLRMLVVEALDRNIVPILSTFPTRPEEPEKSRLFNQVVVKVAADYDIPVSNLNLALEGLANYGVDPNDPLRLSVPADGEVARFTGEHLQSGFVVRNLVALQTLDIVWRAATGK